MWLFWRILRLLLNKCDWFFAGLWVRSIQEGFELIFGLNHWNLLVFWLIWIVWDSKLKDEIIHFWHSASSLTSKQFEEVEVPKNQTVKSSLNQKSDVNSNRKQTRISPHFPPKRKAKNLIKNLEKAFFKLCKFWLTWIWGKKYYIKIFITRHKPKKGIKISINIFPENERNEKIYVEKSMNNKYT